MSAAAPPIRAFDVLKPVGVRRLGPSVAVYDLGQNAALIPKLTVRGPSGSAVRIVPAELLKEDGSVDRRSAEPNLAPAYWQYTLAGDGTETWFPKFYYHGARYLQVECSAPSGQRLPVIESLDGVVDRHLNGYTSAGFLAFVQILPLSVSFYAIKVKEDSAPAVNTSGVWTNSDAHLPGPWRLVNSDNTLNPYADQGAHLSFLQG